MAELKDLVFIDCETTGLDPQKEQIIEVAAVRIDPKTLVQKGVLHAYVQPTIDVPPEIASLNGYSEEKWKCEKAIGIGSLFRDTQLFHLMQGATPAGQNPSFDLAFLNAAHTNWRCGLLPDERPAPLWPEMDYHKLDVASLAWPLFVAGLIPGVSLRHTRKFFGLAGEQHRAMSDVLDAIEVYKRLMRTYTGVLVANEQYIRGIVNDCIFDPELEREATATLACGENAAYAMGLVRTERLDKLREYLELEESRVSVLRGLGLDVLASSQGDLDAVIELVVSHAKETESK